MLVPPFEIVVDLEYDPGTGPDPAAWLSLHEVGRAAEVLRWHEAHDPDVEMIEFHASLQAMVETRIAAGEPEREALARLVRGGLPRHEALHALMRAHEAHMEGAARTLGEGGTLGSRISGLNAARVRDAEVRERQRQASRAPDPEAERRARKARRKAEKAARKRGRRG
jgi:hypothetical protein